MTAVVAASTDFQYCICHGIEGSSLSRYVRCRSCEKLSHRNCVVMDGPDEEFECLLCQLHTLDPFNRVLDYQWYGTLSSGTAVFSTEVEDLEKWASERKEMVLVSVPLGVSKAIHQWPKTFEFHVNGEVVHRVKEPVFGHNRKDNPVRVTYAIRSGINHIEIRATSGETTAPGYLIVLMVCRRVSVDQIVSSIKKKRHMAAGPAKEHLLSMMNDHCEDDEVICLDKGHKIELNCPITLDRMTIPARGKHCKHLQCFDLRAYLHVMHNMSTFSARWRCPECPLIVKPIDLFIDGYVESILSSVSRSVSTVHLDSSGEYTGLGGSERWVDCVYPVEVDVNDILQDHSANGELPVSYGKRLGDASPPSEPDSTDKHPNGKSTKVNRRLPHIEEIIVIDSSDDESSSNSLRHSTSAGTLIPSIGESSTARPRPSTPEKPDGTNSNHKSSLPSTLSQRLSRLPQLGKNATVSSTVGKRKLPASGSNPDNDI
ncbi:MIZ/SP-RING zinc finger family protein [Babesia bovis T2Bo]|uniref:MIZ zinc finger domain containing protein n=1 Tax=Babesia bovis TaxID=5865 RepID=A7AU32_BABBO|nr:MIZ/SP-RING zinc finger family protein [Babesia bovis T2Bo]EDO06443.1 MIZ/SP-RING zinc finger family protein [Babesia bovis T2Bo]|eukprot:XP_001610011.1 MIZ zinc finger domain containing protein [Babesia bovis T2Bo]